MEFRAPEIQPNPMGFNIPRISEDSGRVATVGRGVWKNANVARKSFDNLGKNTALIRPCPRLDKEIERFLLSGIAFRIIVRLARTLPWQGKVVW